MYLLVLVSVHHNELQGTSEMSEAADHKHIPRNPIPPLQNEKLLTHTRFMMKRSLEQCVPASLGAMEVLSTPRLLGCLIVPQPGQRGGPAWWQPQE